MVNNVKHAFSTIYKHRNPTFSPFGSKHVDASRAIEIKEKQDRNRERNKISFQKTFQIRKMYSPKFFLKKA